MQEFIKPGWVYLLEERSPVGPTGYYKIGQTTQADILDRVAGYKAGNPRLLFVLHSVRSSDPRALETRLHRMLKGDRLDWGGGDEWFTTDPAVIRALMEGRKPPRMRSLQLRRILRQARWEWKPWAYVLACLAVVALVVF